MFYSVDLLSAHRGNFGIIWLAATRITDTCFSFGEDLLPDNLELISGSIADNPNDAQSVYGSPGTIQRKKRRVSEHLVLENESGAVNYPLIKLSCDLSKSQILLICSDLVHQKATRKAKELDYMLMIIAIQSKYSIFYIICMTNFSSNI
ncbi:hypothetical protein KSF78_0004441 [Schistosoma japonicum]|nr:hypothetical protein KSF78_0004441 [Schistosoma japonicum]